METEEASGILGSVSYVCTEQELITASRALQMASGKASVSGRVYSLAIFVGGIFLLSGGFDSIRWFRGPKGMEAPLPGYVAITKLGIGIALACAVYSKNYFLRLWFKWIYRAFPLKGEKVVYQFTPLRLLYQHKLAQGSNDWSLITRSVEFRDGFFLMLQPRSGIWIPKHALSDSFGPEELEDLLRSKIKKYKVIDRFAALPEKSKPVELETPTT